MTARRLIYFAVGLAACWPGLAVGAEKENPWKVSVSAGIQFDDNVNTSQLDDTSGQGDKATIIKVSGLYKIFDSKAFGLQAGYDFYQSFYEDLDAFDLQLHSGSLFASKKLAGDSDLRRELVDRSIEKLESATSVLERAKTLAADLETESAHGSAAVVAELRAIHKMIDQVRDDLHGALAPAPIDPGIDE